MFAYLALNADGAGASNCLMRRKIGTFSVTVVGGRALNRVEKVVQMAKYIVRSTQMAWTTAKEGDQVSFSSWRANHKAFVEVYLE